MEPIKLRLQNFTSYADAELDLTQVDLAALTGPNGAGKSSIPDAILWCLFGEATKGGTKALDNYVRRGETECRVELEFRLHGETYRVIRHRSMGKAKTMLELYIWTNIAGSEGSWEPVSGKTVTETQEAIGALLRLDFRTFTASSMILQGQSASLTADMTDAERKEVLARILGLDLWDQLQERAREKGRESKARARVLADQVRQVETKAGRRPQVEESIAGLSGDLASVQLALEGSTATVAELEAQVRQRPTLEQQEKDLKSQIAARITDREQAERDLIQVDKDRAEQEAIIGRPGAVDAELTRAQAAYLQAWDEAQPLTEEVEALEAHVAGNESITTAVASLDQQIAGKESDLAQITTDGVEVHQQLDKHQGIIARAQQIRAASEVAAALTADLTNLDDKAAKYADLDRRCREAEKLVHAWDREHDAAVMTTEAAMNASHRQAHIGDLPCGDDLQAACPLLAGAREAAEMERQAAARLQQLRQEQNPHADAWMGLQAELDALGYNPNTHAAVRRDLGQAQPDAQDLPKLEVAEQAVADLTQRRTALKVRYQTMAAELKDLRAQRERWADSIGKVAAAETRLAELRPKAQAASQKVEAAKTKVAKLEQALTEAQAAAEASGRRVDQLTARREELLARINGLVANIAELHGRLADLQRQLAGYVEIEQRLVDARAVVTEDRRREAEIREQLGRLGQELVEVEKAETELDQLRANLARAEQDVTIYDILDQAAGKKSGVPALIVENAVPQIEHLANELLAGMAGGRFQIRLDTQAEGKSTGTMQEVLRITVLDMGVAAPYITCSGAERFMVDVALRMALSKFLAHRAGAEIQFMVLDEGLGALDAANRPQVMAAIHSAANEFRKVIVITHIQELQDALPQRIEVTRGPSGSTVKVVA